VRVVYVSPHAHLGGAERVTTDLVALHDRAVVEPVVVFLAPGPLVDAVGRIGVPVDVLPAPRLREVLAARQFRRALATRLTELGADLVHGVMAWGHAYAGPAARRAGIPAVWYQHNIPARTRALDLLAALTPAARILANSELTARAQRRINPRRIPIEVVRPGTLLPEAPREQRRARGRAALGLEDGHFVAVQVARLVPGKGHPTFLAAARSLCNARPDVRVVIAGAALFDPEADYAAALRRLAADLGIADRVRFVGGEVDASLVLGAADVAVHVPDGVESYGLAVVEAMAAGAAVVAADGGAVREMVEPGTTAVLVPPGDAEKLAAALVALHDSPEDRARMIGAALTAARERFDARLVTRRVEAVYRAVLESR